MLNGFISGFLLQILSIINFLFAIFIVFRERRNAAVTWAWLMVIVFLPYVGFILYLLIGLDGKKHRTFAIKAKQDEETFRELLDKKYDSLNFIVSQRQFIKHKEDIEINGSTNLNDLAYLMFSEGHGAYSTNNSIKIYHEGNTKFDSLIADINSAKNFVHMLYYIIHADRLGKRIIDALTEKAKQGVEVRLLVDGMGCRGVKKKFYQSLINAGGEVSIFLPPHFIRVNYRNHRKLAIIDGNIGYIGGLNIGDEYLGEDKRFGYWRDAHIRLVGDAVKNIEIRFILDWNFSSKVKFELGERYFPIYEKAKNDSDSGVFTQIVSSGPDTKRSYIHHGFNKMIAEAEVSIYIQTPYFSPDDSIFESLKVAALSGIDVRVMIPAHPDHPFVYWSSLSYLGDLMDAGVKCYKYEKGFVHSKLMVVDGLITSIGTANMDNRSFNLNFESNAFIYDRTTTKTFEEKFLNDLDDCTAIDSEWYDKRSIMTRIKEAISRLISPLL